MRITGKTAGYALAGLGWATLALGLGLDQAGLRAGPALATVGGWVIATGLALSVISATERGFGALDRFFGEILARTRRPAPRVEPTFDAVAEPAPAPALAAPAAPSYPGTHGLPSRRADAPPLPPRPVPARPARPPAPVSAFAQPPLAPPAAPAPAPAMRGLAAAYAPDDDADDIDEAAYAPDMRGAADTREPRLQDRQPPRRATAPRPTPPRLPRADFPDPAARQERGFRPAGPRAQESQIDAYPLDAPQPSRPPALAPAWAPRDRLRAPSPAPLPPASQSAAATPGFDELLDRAALEARVGVAESGEAAKEPVAAQAAPARKPAFHPAPAAPANLDAPRAEARRSQPAPRPPSGQRSAGAAVIEEGEIAGHAYRVLADLTVEIDTVLGARAFDSMEAARRFVGAPDRAARARSVA